MDHREFMQLLKLAEHQMLDLSDTVARLQQHMAELIEENNQLRMANQQLHDSLLTNQSSIISSANQIEANDQQIVPQDKAEVSQGRIRLQAYYDEGIHICHQFFGAHRPVDEECILCLGVLDEMSKN